MSKTVQLVNQTFNVRPWPVNNVGDEKFFGYIVGIGVMPDWDSGKYYRWADFCYNDEYSRYELPEDDSLEKQLISHLRRNMEIRDDGMYGKLWIVLTKKGYFVDLP